MHDTALEIGRRVFEIYADGEPLAILEVGSLNVNGTIRDFAPPQSNYLGIDLLPGPGVDLVLDDPYAFTFPDNHFDLVVSTSCFEHDQMFWLTFLEIMRVTKPGGHVYINSPSNGIYHLHPFDNWRFYPDSGLALTTWARRNGYEVELIESFIARRVGDQWNDCVMVFYKGTLGPNARSRRLSDFFPLSYNIRKAGCSDIGNFTEFSEDQILLGDARDQLAFRQKVEPLADK